MNFDHIAIKVNNIQESVDWYKKNLNADILHQDTNWCVMSVNNIKVAFVLDNTHPPHLCFEIDKGQKEELSLKHKEFEKHRDGSEYLYIKDNSGNFIEYLYWPKINNVN